MDVGLEVAHMFQETFHVMDVFNGEVENIEHINDMTNQPKENDGDLQQEKVLQLHESSTMLFRFIVLTWCNCSTICW
jgi:hypothetical protein